MEKITQLHRALGAVIVLSGLAGVSEGAFANAEQAYSHCPALVDPMQRLACFDSYSNVNSGQTLVPFSVTESRNGAEINEPVRVTPNHFASPLREGLSSHEPNKMLARMDSNDISRLYLDATISIKHPLLTPLVERLFDSTGIELERKPRLYLALSSRFSQYVGSRESSPVVARRYNPELFLRTWGNNSSYWDFGYGHESNGQLINSQQGFEQEEQNYRDNNEPAVFARDGISRGWDYVSVDWYKQWQTGFLPTLTGFTTAHVEWRRFLSNGLLQGAPEEYNDWERQGTEPKPRDEYDGLRFSVQYNLVDELCIVACFDRVELSHSTGYADLFAHNTTSLELTASLLGIPFHIWAMSGYNSDLVDYFDYSNSWGIGMEFTR